jgi:RHS repeat-associated protein
VISEYDNGGAISSPSREYIYAGSGLSAKFEAGTITYFHPDHLSNRLLTDSGGNSVGQTGHYPFGESWYESGNTTKFKFTSYEHDSESGNDFAMARYDVSRFGRFSSPDRIAGGVGAPQSLNRYAYVANDPVNATDPSGMLIIPGGGAVPWGPSFGSNWNEFDLFMMQIGTENVYHANNPNFRFEDFSSSQLAEYAIEGEITRVSSTPIYGLFLLNPGDKFWFGKTCGRLPNKLSGPAGDVRYSNRFNAKMAFQPWLAAALSAAFRDLNAKGIEPSLGGPSPGGGDSIAGFRTYADQVRAQTESGKNPHAGPGTSMHEGGEAIDINGIGSAQGAQIRQAMEDQGFTRVPNDTPHFQMRPYVFPNHVNSAERDSAAAYMAVCTAGTFN